MSGGRNVTIRNNTFTNNSAYLAVAQSYASGGGIYSSGRGKLTVTNSTFTGNQARYGGGISTYFGVQVVITNTTLSGNHADGHSGGLFHYRCPVLTLNNSILAYNTSNLLGTGDLGSFSNLTGSNNLIEDPNFNRPGLVNTITGDPNIDPLANNGGPTQTMALLPGSQAIDAGSDALVPTGVIFDQRGMPYTRISGARVDIGAFESLGLVGDDLTIFGTPGNDTITTSTVTGLRSPCITHPRPCR